MFKSQMDKESSEEQHVAMLFGYRLMDGYFSDIHMHTNDEACRRRESGKKYVLWSRFCRMKEMSDKFLEDEC